MADRFDEEARELLQRVGDAYAASDMRAIIASALRRAAGGWLPIDAQATDGRQHDVCWREAGGLGAHVELGRFKAGIGWCNTYGHPFSVPPDLYRPLPAPPEPDHG